MSGHAGHHNTNTKHHNKRHKPQRKHNENDQPNTMTPATMGPKSYAQEGKGGFKACECQNFKRYPPTSIYPSYPHPYTSSTPNLHHLHLLPSHFQHYLHYYPHGCSLPITWHRFLGLWLALRMTFPSEVMV